MPFVTLISDDDSAEPFVNGTTIRLTLGYIKNPLSFKSTASFYVASFRPNPDDPDAYFYINENTDGLQIRNSEAGDITIEAISQSTDELDQPTALTMQFETMNKIPVDSSMIVTLPSNLVMTASELALNVNGEAVTPEVNEIAFQLTMPVPVDNADSFTVEITNGLKTPAEGPYQYSVWQI